MKKSIRYLLISLTSFILIGAIGYASFLSSKVDNSDGKILNNSYSINLYYDDNTIEVLSLLEEDSEFDLPILNYVDKTFLGWKIDVNNNEVIPTNISSVKDIKEYGGTFNNNNEIDLYAYILDKIPDNKVLLNVTDNTPNKLNPYYILTNASIFSLFNIRYGYQNDQLIIIQIKTSNGTYLTNPLNNNESYFSINDTVNLSTYKKQVLDVVISLSQG